MKNLFSNFLVIITIFFIACSEKGKLATVSTGKFTTYPDTKTVQCEGFVESDGGDMVIERGICYASGSVTPTVSGNHVSGGSGKGSFSAVLQNIEDGIYSYCAYATNSVGTVYGDVLSFTMGEAGGGGSSSTLGASVSDFVGSYNCYAYEVDNQKYVSWGNVEIYTWINSSTNTEWVAVSGLNGGYEEVALGEFDASNKAIRLYSYYRFSNQQYTFEDKGDTLFYSMFVPTYTTKDGSTWKIIQDGAVYDDCGEAWLTFNTEGKVVLGPSKTPDSNGNYANGYTFASLYAENNKLYMWYSTYIEVELTKATSAASPAKIAKKEKRHAPISAPKKEILSTRLLKTIAK